MANNPANLSNEPSVLSPANPGSSRIESIDQLRGYTIIGMIMVNFLGNYDAIPWMFKHHREGYSYADTIAPLFLFIVGMGFRLSFLRRMEKLGLRMARWEAAKRYAVLTLIGIVVYGPFDWRDWWDALVDIGLSGLLALPFIEKSATVRLSAAFFYLFLFQALFTFSPYGPYLVEHSFDGGPLGPLSWVFSLLLGTLAYDWLKEHDRGCIIRNALVYGIVLAAVGWLFRIPWDGFKAEWPFSQRYMTIPYTLYSTGLAFLAFLLFYWASDIKGIRFKHFSMFGLNPLAVYIFHILLIHADFEYISSDASIWEALGMFAGFYLICYVVAWRLWKDKAIIKI